MPNQVQTDYVSRTNLAIDYIVRNLDGELTLEEIAKVACFSPFHFHRVFQSQVGETLNQFVKRLRLERALYLISHAPTRSLTEISLACGFSSSSDFSRSFKSRYGSAPSTFDIQQFRNSQRQEFEAVVRNYEHGPAINKLPAGENPDGFEVTIRDLLARTVAYIRVLDPYQPSAITEAAKRLVTWAEDRELAGGSWLGYMWEDPEIVDSKNCRYDIAVVVDAEQFDFRPEDEIGRFEFPEMQVAEVSISGDIELELRAIDWVYSTWLPESGFVPDDQPGFEAWHGLPFEHGNEHFELSFQLPVKRINI